MTKNGLNERIDRAYEMIDLFNEKLNGVKSFNGTVPHQIDTKLKPLCARLDNIEVKMQFNANLMNLLMEYLKIGFYEIPAQNSKIEIRKTGVSKKKGR